MSVKHSTTLRRPRARALVAAAAAKGDGATRAFKAAAVATKLVVRAAGARPPSQPASEVESHGEGVEEEEEVALEAEARVNKAKSMFRLLWRSKEPLAVFLQQNCHCTGKRVVGSAAAAATAAAVMSQLPLCGSPSPAPDAADAANFSTDWVDMSSLTLYYQMWLQYTRKLVQRAMFINEKVQLAAVGGSLPAGPTLPAAGWRAALHTFGAHFAPVLMTLLLAGGSTGIQSWP